MVIYYNTRNLPRQNYRIISHIERPGRWTSKKMIEHSMYPWKNVQPDNEISSYKLEGEDGSMFMVDADILLQSMMNRNISVINARVEGYRIRYSPNITF